MASRIGPARGDELRQLSSGRRKVLAAGRAITELLGDEASQLSRTAAAEAIRAFQQRAGLEPTGDADDRTVDRLVAELAHDHLASSKVRTARLQSMLSTVGFPASPEESGSKELGGETVAAVKRFQESQGLVVDGLAGEKTLGALRQQVLHARMSSKRQTALFQRKLLKAAAIRGIPVQIDPTELRNKTMGESTRAALALFQSGSDLSATGDLDVATFERITSIAASRHAPVARVAPPAADAVVPLRRGLRLNMAGKDIANLQQALALLGHPPSEAEFQQSRFGRSTREAVLAYQAENGLPSTGAADGQTLRSINDAIGGTQPTARDDHRIRGSVRDAAWQGMPGVTVELSRVPAVGSAEVLGTVRTLSNGFYDLVYRNPVGAGRTPSAQVLKVRFVTSNGTELGTKFVNNPGSTVWVNFTMGPYPYQGRSLHEISLQQVRQVGVAQLGALSETPTDPQITRVSALTGLLQDDLMRLVLAERAASHFPGPVDAAVCFAFLAQNLPSNLPGDLLAQTHDWTLIDQLTDLVVTGIARTEPAQAMATLELALRENLVPVTVSGRLARIEDALTQTRLGLALDRPLLAGNGTLRATLERSAVPADRFDAVADAFAHTGGMGTEFWTRLRQDPARYGGAAAVASLEEGVEVGLIVKNHGPALDLAFDRIRSAGNPEITSARDLAKFDVNQWEQFARDVGSVPENTDGTTAAERTTTYAQTMQSQAERLFPTVALTASVRRNSASGVDMIGQIEKLVDEHPELELRTTNVDRFLTEHVSDPAPGLRTQLRLLQRVNRLAPTAESGAALLAAGVHSAVQILSLGLDALTRKLEALGVDSRVAAGIHAYAEVQYAQVLQRVGELRSETQSTLPDALAPMRLTSAVREELVRDWPDLELLFGELDACDCPHCASIHGPAAYLADLLRFLDAHDAELGAQSVREVLSGRRPDISRTKLDCANTDTALPHIDLVNEILESVHPSSAGWTDRQTTLPADELLAAPEHQDDAVHDALRNSAVPLSSSYDLWQDQTRVLLDHLGVPRWRLMTTFRAVDTDIEAAVDAAAEYFGISSNDRQLVVSAHPERGDQDNLWGFDSGRSSVPVPEFLERTKLSYGRLQLLLQCGWLTPPGEARVVLSRPATSADLSRQSLENLTPGKFDRIHRLLRLERHTPWDPWELGLLLKADRLGAGELDGDALVQLQAAARLAERLHLDAETLSTWFGTFPDQGRPDTADPSGPRMPSLYETTFLGRGLNATPNPAFSPVPDGSDLRSQRPTLLAALGVSDPGLTLLLKHTGTVNSARTLSGLAGWSGLSRRLGLDLNQLLAAADLLVPEVPDPFASPTALQRFLSLLDELLGSGLGIAEQVHLLSAQTASPFASPDGDVTNLLQGLRESIRTDPALDPLGGIRAWVAAAFGIDVAAARILLGTSDADGRLQDAYADPSLLAREADGAYVHPVVAPGAFPRLHEVHRRMTKMATAVKALGLDVEGLAWLLDQVDTIGFSLTDLPVGSAPASPLITGWLRVLAWTRARRDITRVAHEHAGTTGASPTVPDTTFDELFAVAATSAPIGSLRDLASRLTGIDTPTLETLDEDLRERYTDSRFLQRLADASDLARRIRGPAAMALSWSMREHADADTERSVAGEVLQAVRSRYDRSAWLTVLRPMQDLWRVRKRDALVAFLLEHAARTQPATVTIAGRQHPNPRRWTSAADLFGYFLIDMETTPKVMTSRLKQAIGSVQMFVQRAQLNLESPEVLISTEEKSDLSSPNSWRQWRWMRNYRIWEANRRIFLYPENWISPELRDDKTPFFTELEQDILSGEITAERCEEAIRAYLGKLKQVSNLEVVGTHHEIDDHHPWDNLSPSLNLLHVVARTRGEPRKYFYRRFDLNSEIWSPWEVIDVDIAADQVLPVVYNRTLHLFWLQAERKPQKGQRQPAAQPSSGTAPAPEPPEQLELKLSWTERRGDGWTAKQTAPDALVHPWPRPLRSYTLKPRYHAALNQLALDVYISMSHEFNNGWFWDPRLGYRRRLSHHRFTETARPWHSSSFIFDGKVVELRLKSLKGVYPQTTDSGDTVLVQRGSFAFVRDLSDPQGRILRELRTSSQVSARLVQPAGMHLEAGRMCNNTEVANDRWLRVIQQGADVALLAGAKPPFATVQSLHRIQLDTAAARSPFFYLDAARSYFVTSSWADVRLDSTTVQQRLRYTFAPFHHPYAALLSRELDRSGPSGVLNRTMQRFPQQYLPGNTFSFDSYSPVTGVAEPSKDAERDVLEFSRSGAFSVYNWEVFFHIPFLFGSKLAMNQRFEEALDWLHLIFDPSNTDAVPVPQRFWITRPFFEATDPEQQRQRIENLLANADDPEVVKQITEWRNQPFQPDVIARLRPVAYQKAVVMKYLDVLIAWGDQLFRRDTIESLNEATLLYVLAQELLGRRPEHVPAIPREPKTYEELTAAGSLDSFGAAEVEVQLENLTTRPTLVIAADEPGSLPLVRLSYFGIPPNQELLGYWDTVADRLFKLRNSLNIQGVERQLPLFEPPIDPALLVRAAAMGLDLTSVLDPPAATASPYRYQTLWAAAMSAASDVQSLGERMLLALERRDADSVERLRATNEAGWLSVVTRVREAQVHESERSREALEAGLDVLQGRIDHYAAQSYMNEWEVAATVVHAAAIISKVVSTVLDATAGVASLVPSFTVGVSGFGGSPHVSMSYGGSNYSGSAGSFAKVFEGAASILQSTGGMLETQGSYRRRHDENMHQAQSARREYSRLEKEIVAAQVREAVAHHELEAHDRQVANAASMEELLRTRYTNSELYEWLVAQLSTVYFQAYQLAFDMAKRAERAFRYETADANTVPVIQFGYWDSLRKGLLAGDRLVNDLRRLESLSLEMNRRRLQATTHVSLATHLPHKLLELRTTGRTMIELPEWLFARENPGWYGQRIRSVSVSAPCVSGPQAGVHATLTLTQAVVRTSDSVVGGFGDAFAGTDQRFAAEHGMVTSIRTSHGIDDRGRLPDIGSDDRYEPFEGAGLISRWTIEMDPRDNAFDPSTLSDFVLHISYEGLQGQTALVDLARSAVSQALPANGALLVWLDGSHASEWSRFLHPATGEQSMTFTVVPEDLPFLYRQQVALGKRLLLGGADLVLESSSESVDVRLTPPAGVRTDVLARPGAVFGELLHAPATWSATQRPELLGSWNVQLRDSDAADWASLGDERVRHAWLLLRFEVVDGTP